MESWIFGLVFRQPDGTYLEEPWQFLGRRNLAHALACARRDGSAAEFGRQFVGVRTIEPADAEPWRSRRIPKADVPSLKQLDAKLRAGGFNPVRWREPRLDGEPIPELERVAWWETESAFGTGTLAGVLLRRCLTAPKTAKDSAELLGEAIAHQMTLYSVTPLAVAAIGATLERMPASAREVLKEWLEIVADAAKPDPNDRQTREELAATLLAEGTPELLVDSLVERELAARAAAEATRAAVRRDRERFQALARRGLVGPRLRKLAR